MAQVNARLEELIGSTDRWRRLAVDLGEAYCQRTIGWAGCDPVKAEVELAGQLAFRHSNYAGADPLKGTWAARRKALRDDPHVVLPDLLASPASAPPPPSAA